MNTFIAKIIDPHTGETVTNLKTAESYLHILPSGKKAHVLTTTFSAKQFCRVNAEHFAENTGQNGVIVVYSTGEYKELARQPILRLVKNS